ncbi:hypothetical protein KZJ38_32465 [Paraburkholderia edwinii]|uniref:Pilus assembly protein PilM n=1 Tax=Paraburkholderia edwinii TaxID=2861782 RepID=A0ABX8URR1_9BURK|nr:hypothetical protein [Paraburkholderia edwinii]QYD71706.1 hypothetical protein KZJ38_32465 [Paraburkholderia edwinii]
MRDAWKRLGAKPVSLPGLPRVSLKWRRGVCHIGFSRDGVAALRASAAAPRKAATLPPVIAERSLRGISSNGSGAASADDLAALIAGALDEAGCSGLPIHASFGDDLVRYFIVTPPPNGTRVQDLRTAAEVRFQMLYGESLAAWRLVADWHATKPFLACAVPARLHTALQLAARAQRSCLVSTSPNFVGAWNRWRRRVTGDAWLATLHDGALTLGVIGGAGRRARLAAVRTLKLSDETPPLAWLNEQLARTALLDNVPAPKVLHVYGRLPQTWQQTQRIATTSGSGGANASTGTSLDAGSNASPSKAMIEVRACTAVQASPALPQGAYATLSSAAQLATQIVLSSRGGASR